MQEIRHFRLSQSFVEEFKGKQPKWGPVGYITYKRTYARDRGDGTVEEFWETCKRVVEGTYHKQKEHCYSLGLPWDNNKAQRSAQEMFRRMWDFKWLPPGRGLWMMGTDNVDRIGAALNNCGMVSTEDIAIDLADPFCWMMDMLMLGVGIGFDTKGAGLVKIQEPKQGTDVFVVEDSREGWVDLLRRIITAFSGKGSLPTSIDYSQVRPLGSPIKGFGGVASGPAPLDELVQSVKTILMELVGDYITVTAIVDICNLIGRCVVAGNVRRCLPQDTLVHTNNGLVKIKDIEIGTKVKTTKGWYPVINKFDQGIQKLYEVETQLGVFKATGNHKVKVFTDVNKFDFKMIKDLRPEDRLVFSADVQEYENTQQWPEWSYDYPKHSTTCKALTIPVFDENSSWFLGLLHGDGYVNRGSNEKGFNAYVSIACSPDYPNIIENCKSIIKSFGVNLCDVLPKESDKVYKVRTQSKQLAWYLSQFKTPNEPMSIPPMVINGTSKQRAAYVAGLFDADGSCKTRPLQVAVSVYPSFLKEVQALLATLGIPSRLKLSREKIGKWKSLYSLDIVGEEPVLSFDKLIAPFSRKYKNNKKAKRGGNDHGFPSNWMKGTIKGWCNTAKQITISTYGRAFGVSFTEYPVTVKSIRSTDFEDHTYDLEVADAHEFVIGEGLVVHNSAEISFGDPDSQEFLDLKNPEMAGEALMKSRWASNNSIFAEIGMDYSKISEYIAKNGEPGLLWLDNAKAYSRMDHAPDWKDRAAKGANPCSEQTLHNRELCCLVETFPGNHDSYEDYQKTLKYAYLYAKTVTLVSTHDFRTNQVLLRNRRIGTSMSGIVQAMKRHGRREFLSWCDKGYFYIKELDKDYSDWLCVRESIKITSVKPSGTISLLPGVTPGIHFPHSEYYIRRIRFQDSHPLVQVIKDAGYHIEDDRYSPKTVVVEFHVKEEFFDRAKKNVTMWEQLELAAQIQRYWADNQVSVTVTFSKEEANQIKHALELYETRLKSVSFLPLTDHGYVQAPYEEITKEEYERRQSLVKFNLEEVNTLGDVHDKVDRFCDGDKCEIR